MLKHKHLIWFMCLLVGIGYFSAMSNWEIHYFWKSLIAFIGFITTAVKILIVVGFVAVFLLIGLALIRTWSANRKSKE